MKELKLGTTFSGVGAIEHALQRLNIKHKIIFACDNGGNNLFSKKIIDRFIFIDNEINFISKYIDSLKLNNDEEYKLKLFNELNKIKEQYKTVINNNVLNSFDNLKDIINIILKEFKKSNDIKFKEFIDKNLDISDYLYLSSEIKNYIKKRKHKYFDKLLEITKNKEYRKIRRDIKEISKKLTQLHESILTLEILDKLDKLNTYKEKKIYVDSLYKKENFVKKSYLANYKLNDIDFHQNISFLNGEQYKNKIDLYVGGSPCQSFSIVGKRGGFEDTRGTLFYEYVRVLKETNPRFFIYENVKGVLSHDSGKTWEIMKNTFEETGYMFKYFILNAKDFGIPQHRERLFVIGFKNINDFNNFQKPKYLKLNTSMKDFLEDNVDSKYYLPEKGIKFVTDEKNIKKKYTQLNGEIALCQKANQQFNWHGDFVEYFTDDEKLSIKKIEKKYFLSDNVKNYILDNKFYMNNKPSEELIDLDIARPLTASMHKMHRAGVDNYISYGKKLNVKDRKIRKLTPCECFRLMGFCDSFEFTVSDTQLYQQAGNSIVVDVLMSILKEIKKIY